MNRDRVNEAAGSRLRSCAFIIAPLVLAVVAMACHANPDPELHLTSEHYNQIPPGVPPEDTLFLHEGWCVDSTSLWMDQAPSTPSDATVSTRIDDALTGNGNEDWDDGDRIRFFGQGDCDDFDSTTTPPRS